MQAVYKSETEAVIAVIVVIVVIAGVFIYVVIVVVFFICAGFIIFDFIFFAAAVVIFNKFTVKAYFAVEFRDPFIFRYIISAHQCIFWPERQPVEKFSVFINIRVVYDSYLIFPEVRGRVEIFTRRLSVDMAGYP